MASRAAFDPILRISDLESSLAKANDRIKELEYLLAQLTENIKGDSKAGAAAEATKKLLEENVRLKAEVQKLSQTKAKNDKLMFSMGREHAAVSSRLANRKASSVTLKRLNYRAAEVKILQEEVVRWLNGLLTAPTPTLAAPLTTATLLDSLSSGWVLCALIRRIDPKYNLGKVHEKAPAGSFFAHDNVKAFLSACTAWGVPAHALFETNDLVGTTKNVRAVVHGILSLSKVVAALYGIPPPEIVRIDMELDALEGKKPTANAAVGAQVAPSPTAEQEKKLAEARKAEEEAVAKAIAEMVKQFGVPPPTKVKGTLYTFLNATGDAKEKTITAHVRLLRGTPLIRLNDGWEELSAYMIQIAQTHGVGMDTPEEQAIKKRIDEAVAPVMAQLVSVTTHRDALATQVTELQHSASNSASEAAKAAEFAERVKVEVAKATAELREQLMRAVDEKDRSAQNATELATLRSTLATVQSERDALTGQLIDAQSRQLRSSSDATSAKTEAETQIGALRDQLLQAVKARDAALLETTELKGNLSTSELKFAQLSKLQKEEAAKHAEALSAAAAAQKAAVEAATKSPAPKKGVTIAPGSAGGKEVDSDDEAPEDKEKRKRREDEAAYKEFFYLTALAVKMNHNAQGDAIELAATAAANSTDLFEKARAQEVAFHQFHKWIEREITMAYLLASHQSRAEFSMTTMHHHDLRSLRASRQSVIKHRPHMNPIIADSSKG